MTMTRKQRETYEREVQSSETDSLTQMKSVRSVTCTGLGILVLIVITA